ncbi:MAG: type II toxin-antitoxin system HicA family toxin [Thermoleophilia bacterium]|nr:type II toxin-antitoxin system HicA family toxin [Thermoleophilia bacterium]
MPVMNAKAAVKLLRSNDFAFVRQRGSHATYAHASNGRQAVVPMHNGDLPRGTLRSILQQAGLGVEALSRR